MVQGTHRLEAADRTTAPLATVPRNDPDSVDSKRAASPAGCSATSKQLAGLRRIPQHDSSQHVTGGQLQLTGTAAKHRYAAKRAQRLVLPLVDGAEISVDIPLGQFAFGTCPKQGRECRKLRAEHTERGTRMCYLPDPQPRSTAGKLDRSAGPHRAGVHRHEPRRGG